MRACTLHAVGDLRHEEVANPVPRPGEVLIRIRACGVCGSDIPRVFTRGTYHFPTIPGHEFAGEVVEAGPSVPQEWVGKHVAVFPLIPCRACAPCEIGAYAQCEAYDYLGSRCDGAFAEYVCAPTWNLVEVPQGVSFEEAAMAEPAAVAAHALRQAGVDLGDTVAIWGAGPIGLMLAFWAKVWGAAQVLLVDIDAEKLAFARKVRGTPLGGGEDDTFDGRSGDAVEWVRRMTQGRGADVVVEASGSSPAFEQAMLAARTFGRVALLGNPAGAMQLSQKAYWAILRNELTVRGSWNSAYAALPRNEWRLSLDAIATKRLDVASLITHRVALPGLREALVMMRDRTQFFNKVMCTM